MKKTVCQCSFKLSTEQHADDYMLKSWVFLWVKPHICNNKLPHTVDNWKCSMMDAWIIVPQLATVIKKGLIEMIKNVIWYHQV